MVTEEVTITADAERAGDNPAHRVQILSTTEVYVDHRTNRRHRLLFGAPCDVVAMDHTHAITARLLSFRPGDVFGLSLWEANDFGTTHWRVLVCRALRSGETGVRLPQVRPGARALLDVVGATRAKAALRWLSPYVDSGEAAAMPDEAFIVAGFRMANMPLARLKSYAAGRL